MKDKNNAARVPRIPGTSTRYLAKWWLHISIERVNVLINVLEFYRMIRA